MAGPAAARGATTRRSAGRGWPGIRTRSRLGMGRRGPHRSETRIHAIAQIADPSKHVVEPLLLFLGRSGCERGLITVGATDMELRGVPNRFPPAHDPSGETATEVAMPLIYLPLIMYASFMEFMAQPYRAAAVAIDRKARTDAHRSDRND